jgi:hypothetical protein
MALLYAQVDSDIICLLVSHWHSDEMFHYLHAHAYLLMPTFAQQMSIHESFTLAPGQHVLSTGCGASPEPSPCLDLSLPVRLHLIPPLLCFLWPLVVYLALVGWSDG